MLARRAAFTRARDRVPAPVRERAASARLPVHDGDSPPGSQSLPRPVRRRPGGHGLHGRAHHHAAAPLYGTCGWPDLAAQAAGGWKAPAAASAHSPANAHGESRLPLGQPLQSCRSRRAGGSRRYAAAAVAAGTQGRTARALARIMISAAGHRRRSRTAL